MPDSDDEMMADIHGKEAGEKEEEAEVPLTPQEWKEKADDLYKVCAADTHVRYSNSICCKRLEGWIEE